MNSNRTPAKKLLIAAAAAVAMTPAFAADQLAITTLSSRPDMVSGGNALLRVDVPAQFSLGQIVVKLNGQDVTSAFHADQASHALTGLVNGLSVGAIYVAKSRVIARLRQEIERMQEDES